jgi:hypothetical protein
MSMRLTLKLTLRLLSFTDPIFGNRQYALLSRFGAGDVEGQLTVQHLVAVEFCLLLADLENQVVFEF